MGRGLDEWREYLHGERSICCAARSGQESWDCFRSSTEFAVVECIRPCLVRQPL